MWKYSEDILQINFIFHSMVWNNIFHLQINLQKRHVWAAAKTSHKSMPTQNSKKYFFYQAWLDVKLALMKYNTHITK
jgi:hypothetical protein